MLAVSCQFHPFEEKKENAGIDQDKRWKKSYLAPETIIVHTQGDK